MIGSCLNIQGVKLPSFFSALTIVISVLFFYSTSLEKSRVVTFAKPMVITQARRTPAFQLYQHALDKDQAPVEIIATETTFISTESLKLTIKPVIISEMILAQQEIGTKNDFGFQVSVSEKADSEKIENLVKSISQSAERPKSSSIKKWGTIRGKFEVKDGVGVVDHIVEIKRIEEGQVRELGQIDLQAGSYAIDIENPQGTLIAQIKDKNGILIGEDQQKIMNLQSQGNYFEGPFIRVGRPQGIAANPGNSGGQPSYGKPLGGSLATRNLANNSRGKADPTVRSQSNQQVLTEPTSIVASLFSKQLQLENPKEQFLNISKNSSTISIIEDQKKIHQSIITIRQTADEIEIPLFTKKWLSGDLNYVSDQMKIEFKSKTAPVIIGQTRLNNAASAGVTVEIESQPGLKAIYLDEYMIPNLKLESTSENGYFLFVGLESGTYPVVASKSGTVIGQQLFIAEENHISYQHIVSSTAARSILFRTYDAFSAEPQDSDIVIPDYVDILETAAGTASYRTYNQLGLSQFIVRAKQDYMPINYIQDARKDHVHVPLIREPWLLNLQSQQQINDQPNTGTIVGFVPELEKFELYLISESYDSKQIVYFDRLGEVSTTPISGGGFIMFNVPVGAQEVLVQEIPTGRVFSQVHIVKLNQTSVSHFNE